VQIDPSTFDGMVLPNPERMMPSADWGYAQREFWEAIDLADAVSLESQSEVSGSHPRYGNDKFMTLKVNFADLLSSEAGKGHLIAAAGPRLEALVGQGDLHDQYDVVLVDPREAEIEHFEGFVTNLLGPLAAPLSVFPTDGGVGDDLRDRLVAADRVLLFRLGLVSGLSLQQALYGVQALRRGAGRYDIDGLVMHLRPEDGRIRETLNNSLARRLVSLWESYIPETRHPLQEELDIIGAIHGMPAYVEEFLNERLATCSGFTGDSQVLWGGGDHTGATATRLSPMSYYGEDLRVRSAFAAICAAVHHARVRADEPRRVALWRMFEMTAILRSYYDPIIIASILRWLKPTEIWWGEDLQVAREALLGSIRRTNLDDRVMLVSELLLAASQSKVMPDLIQDLLREGELLAASLGEPDDAPLRLGLAAVALLAEEAPET